MKGSGAITQGTTVLLAASRQQPRDANLQDSLAEFCAAQGLRAQALAAYRQALLFDPCYPGAVAAKAAILQLGGEAPAVAVP